jgi:CubicO group peptidase (beta-lactamase class C family)
VTSHDLRDALEASRLKHDVPGVSAAIYEAGSVSAAAGGVANLSTGVEMTTETLAHIGSITKTVNATILMQLVDEGKVELDHKVLDYLPDFRVEDAEATQAITVEMLVNHTSGIDGTLLPGLSHDEETIERTARRFAGVRQVHAAGHGRSYCNAGTVIAGYLSQRITGTSWYDLVKDRIFKPLGMKHAAVLPEDALLHRTSVGHFRDPATGTLKRSSHVFLPIGYASAGSTAMMSATDLLMFARAHLGNGLTRNDTRILSKQSAIRMRAPSPPIGGPAAFDCGIAWIRNKAEIVQHGGGGPGIVSCLFVHPPSQTAAVVLTNAEHGIDVMADLVNPFMKEHAGFEPFPLPPAPVGAKPRNLERYVGHYENSSEVHEFSIEDGNLMWSAHSQHQFYDSSRLDAPPPKRLVPAEGGLFLGNRGHGLAARDCAVIGFADPDADGMFRYAFQRLWLYRRRDDRG